MKDTLDSQLAAAAKEGINAITQLRALIYISARHSAEPSRLARHLGKSTAAVTGIIDALEDLEFIERVHSTADRRKVYPRITPKGNVALDRITNSQPVLA